MISANIGGMCMGRYYYDSKTTVEDCRQININNLKSWDYLNKGMIRGGTITWTSSSGIKNNIGITVNTCQEDQYVNLNYTRTYNDDSKKDFDYKVYLTTTDCNYGGKRFWFVCPLVDKTTSKHCGRRMGVLYLVGDYFGCRNCFNLSYDSRNKNRRYKMYSLFESLLLDKKISETLSCVKLKYYNGRLTRQYKKVINLVERSNYHVNELVKGGLL
jgi:hypothetical protein